MHRPGYMSNVPHDKHCRQFEQTPIKRIDLSKPIPEDLIKKTQKRSVITSAKGAESRLPKDARTIPELSDRLKIEFKFAEGRARHLSRSEAIRRIKKDELVLHSGEMDKRDAQIEKLLKDLFNCTQYYATQESYLTDFIDFDKKDRYKLLANRIHKAYGFHVCAGCLYEARYIWRQVDLIEKYRSVS